MPPRGSFDITTTDSRDNSPRGPMATTTNSSGSSLQLKLYRQQSSFRFSECQRWLTGVWALHFAACILVISIGSLMNYGARKYIPIDVDSVVDQECSRGFVDVFSSSIDDPGAFVCCNDDDSSNNPIICRSPPGFLLFAGRLSRFPDAWLLPLFPLFFRGLVHMLRRLQGSRGSSSASSSKSDIMYAKRRLVFYIALIQIRGWVLYLLFDKIEAMFVSTTTFGGSGGVGGEDETCWYEDLLLYRKNYESCQGRVSDFSDHVVLYYAQILPIALTEVLHSFVLPYWETKDHIYYGKKYFNVIPLVLLFWLGNLYVITFLGAYKTSVYFHTGAEVFVGYLVSLCIQVPLFLLQCTVTFPRLRDWLYGYSMS